MARLETTLNPEVFLRVHRSSIVNLQYVKEVKNDTDGESIVVLAGGEKIAMSRGYRARIQKLLHR
jgi:two-component system LytT family response regulator